MRNRSDVDVLLQKYFICLIAKYCNYAKQSRRQSSRLKGGQAFIRGGQNLKLSTKVAVFKRESLLIRRTKHVDWGARLPWPPLAPALMQSIGIRQMKYFCKGTSISLQNKNGSRSVRRHAPSENF